MLIITRYVETIQILYAKSRFHVAVPEVLLCLTSVLLPQHASSICNLDYHCRYDEPPQESSPKHKHWASIWKILASFIGLKRLRVRIITRQRWKHQWQVDEARLLEYVKLVVRPKDFELIATWPPGGQLSDLPCRLLRESSNLL
jgi:hypothetical protein